jgi:hypothetical protein
MGRGLLVVDSLKQAARDVAACSLKVEQEVEALQFVTHAASQRI